MVSNKPKNRVFYPLVQSLSILGGWGGFCFSHRLQAKAATVAWVEAPFVQRSSLELPSGLGACVVHATPDYILRAFRSALGKVSSSSERGLRASAPACACAIRTILDSRTLQMPAQPQGWPLQEAQVQAALCGKTPEAPSPCLGSWKTKFRWQCATSCDVLKLAKSKSSNGFRRENRS